MLIRPSKKTGISADTGIVEDNTEVTGREASVLALRVDGGTKVTGHVADVKGSEEVPEG